MVLQTCPECRGKVSSTSAYCPHCGYGSNLVQRHNNKDETRTSNLIAGVCSFFFPGLGQLLQGRVGMAIFLFIMTFAMWFVLLGWIGHLVAAYEAAVHGQ